MEHTATVPSFLCVGMPKCGTSTLYHVLSELNGFYLPPFKELKYFSNKNIGYNKSIPSILFSKHWAARQDRRSIVREVRELMMARRPVTNLAWLARYIFGRADQDWYRSLFKRDAISGDISPIYHELERSDIQEIRVSFPDVKIIIMLRSPLEQIWSHCRMVLFRQQNITDNENYIEHIEQLTSARRTYSGLVRDWQSSYPESVFVGYLEDLSNNPLGFFEELLSFLGVERDITQKLAGDGRFSRKSHVGVHHDVPDRVRSVLAEHALIRLDGFDAISHEWDKNWRLEIEDFRRTD